MSDIEVEVDIEEGIEVEVDFPDIVYNASGGGDVTITDTITNTVIATISAPGKLQCFAVFRNRWW
jgi:hypothetical protein